MRVLSIIVLFAAFVMAGPASRAAATPSVGIPAGATTLSSSQWQQLVKSGEIGDIISGGKLVKTDSAAGEPSDTVSDVDPGLGSVAFLSDKEVATETTSASRLYALPANQLRLYAVLAAHVRGAASVESVKSLGSSQLIAANVKLAEEAYKENLGIGAGAWAGRPVPNGCTSDTLGYGDGSDVNPKDFSSKRTFSPQGIMATVDFPLRAYAPCVKSQGARGTCTMFGSLGAIEEITAEKYGYAVDLSEQAAAAEDKLFWQPSLTGGESVAQLLRHSESGYVIPFEKAWDYNQGRVKAQPCSGYTQYCSPTAGEGRAVCATVSGKLTCGYQTQVPAKHDGLRVLASASVWSNKATATGVTFAKALLQEGYPLIFGSSTKDHFGPGRSGYIKAPSSPKRTGDLHCYNVIGYVSNETLHAKSPSAPPGAGGGYFVVRNSWSRTYGDNGYGYMPVAWAMAYVNTSYAVFDVDLVASNLPHS